MAKVIISVHGIMDKDVCYSDEWFGILQLSDRPELVVRQFYWDDLNGNLDEIAKIITPESFKSTIGKISDVVTYKKYRSSITDQLAAVILMWQHRGFDVHLLTHSLGTVVAFHTLRSMSNQDTSNVGVVTMGSPMVSPSFRFIFNVDDKPMFLKNWLNLSGRNDPICMFGRKMTNFAFQDKKNLVPQNCNHDAASYIKLCKGHILRSFGI